MNILIKNLKVFNPDQKTYVASLHVKDEKVFKIIKNLKEIRDSSHFDQVIDGKGLYCFPGFIDLHCHLRDPGFEDCETIASGSRAAAAGGFTTVCCMPNTNPVNDHPHITKLIQEKIKHQAVIEVLPIGAISEGLKGERLAQIGLCLEEGIIAISDDGKCISSTAFMQKALAYSKQFDLPVVIHAEHPDLVYDAGIHTGKRASLLGLKGSPALAEEVIVARDIVLAERLKAKLHIAHISSWQALEHVRRAKDRGVSVTAEVCPHHLLLTEKAADNFNTYAKVSPPLRTTKHVEALRKALKQDVIDALASDHAPWSEKYKDLPFQEAHCGINGFETAFSLTYKLVEEKVLTLNQLIKKWTSGPAQVFGLGKPEIKEKNDANLVLVNLDETYKIDSKKFISKSKNTPFDGTKVSGRIKYTLYKGKVVYDHTTSRSSS